MRSLAAAARFALAGLVAVGVTGAAQQTSPLGAQQPGHAESPSVWVQGPVAPREMEARIVGGARQLPPGQVAARIGFSDIAYPASVAEFDATAGHALLLVTALTQDSAGLPLRRVYGRVGVRVIELRAIRSVLSRRAARTPASIAFGRFEQDAIYLLPASLVTEQAEILADFPGREHFRLTALSTDGMPPALAKLLTRPPRKGPPDDGAVTTMVRREYPGVFVR